MPGRNVRAFFVPMIGFFPFFCYNVFSRTIGTERGSLKMNREQLEKYLCETYAADRDYPWSKYPNYAVFRHSDNRKWFAVIMEVSQSKLGLADDGSMDIVNFKCDPAFIGSLRMESGFFPAYHMNKDNWITAALDGTADEEKIKVLADMSYALTKTKKDKSSPPDQSPYGTNLRRRRK